jgi:preprotein translocase subunit SecE
MDNRKIILLFFTLSGIVVWFLTRSSIQYLYLTFYQVRRLGGIVLIKEILPVILGGICFGILFRNPKANTFLDESVNELKKVSWPNRQDVVRSTTVVIFCILIASGILMFFDVMWSKMINFFLKV